METEVEKHVPTFPADSNCARQQQQQQKSEVTYLFTNNITEL